MAKPAQECACRECMEKFQERNYTQEVAKNSTGGICKWCGKWKPEIIWFTFQNREERDRASRIRRRKENNYRPEKDTMAHWREPWRGE